MANSLQQVSTLHKQNFDLKLELYHRRQRQETLEAKLEAAEKQIVEQAEIQEVNEQLLAELERRDQALDEAVGVIVKLEERIEKLLEEREMVRSVDAEYGSKYSHQAVEGPPSSLSEYKEATKPARPPNVVLRMPSFLSDNSEGTEALRSLYLPHKHSFSETTLPKLEEEGSVDLMNSPRLSLLSESSFLSVYGEKPSDLDVVGDVEEPPTPTRRHRKSSSVEKWIDQRPVPEATPIRLSPGLLPRKNQFLSINDVLESPLQRIERLQRQLQKAQQPDRSASVQEKCRPKDVLRRVFTDKTSFEHQQGLPPTPDTISTSTLRHYQYSNDTLAQDHEDAKEQSFLNNTSSFPVPGLTYNTYQSALSMRPRSAGETVTSRREGHGWDTETQEDLTETGSIESTASTYCHQQNSHPKRVMTPELFTFGRDDRDDLGGWGRDMMVNAEPHLPVHRSRHHTLRALRRSSVVDHPRSDDTVVPSTALTRYDEESLQRPTPIDTSPRPHPPDRRSSLSAVSKLRKSNHSSNTSTTATAGSSPSSPAKKSRLPNSLRIFGRSETSTASNISQELPQPLAHSMQRPKNVGRSYSYLDHGDLREQEEDRATPPPIRRNRTHVGSAYRPSSAGTGTARRPSQFGYDGAGDENDMKASPGHGRRGSVDVIETSAAADDTNSKSGRRWFGIKK